MRGVCLITCRTARASAMLSPCLLPCMSAASCQPSVPGIGSLPPLTVGPRLQRELPSLLLVVASYQRVRLADGKRQVGLHCRAWQQDATLAHIAARGAAGQGQGTGYALGGLQTAVFWPAGGSSAGNNAWATQQHTLMARLVLLGRGPSLPSRPVGEALGHQDGARRQAGGARGGHVAAGRSRPRRSNHSGCRHVHRRGRCGGGAGEWL